MEEVLRNSEEKYRHLLENARDTIMTLDLNGDITFVNRAVEEYGFKKDEIVGKKMGEFVPEEYLPRLIKDFAKVVRGNSVEGEVEIITPKGKIIAEYRSSPIRRENKVIGSQTILRDITERKRIEEELRESEERFRNLYKSIKDPVVVYVGREGRLVEYNKAFKEQTGYTDEELKDKTFLDFVHPDDRAMVLERYRTKYPEEKLPLVYEIKVVNKKGETVPLEISVSPYKVRGKVVGVESIGRDITERKKTEEELVRLSNAVKMSNDSIVISDLDANIIDVNEATLKMYGTDDKGDLIGKFSFDLLAPEDRDKALAGTREVLERGYVKGREYRIITKDGGRIPVEMSVAVMKDEDGEPIGFVGISRDITERKQAEEALRASDKNWSDSFNALEDVMILINKDYTIEKINDNGLRLLGKTREEVIGKKCHQVVHGMDAPCEFCSFKKTLKTEKVESVDRYIELFDKYFSIKGTPIFNEHGEIVRFIDLMRDTTERKQMEEKLSESEERFRNLYESIQDPVGVYVGREGRLIEYNESFKRLSGFTDEELKDKTFLDLVHPDDQAMVLEKYRTKYPEEKLPLVYELRSVVKNGGIVPVEISVSPYEVKGKVVGIEVIHRDITKRKQMEEKLRQYSEHLEELVRKRTEELSESEKRYSVLVEEASDGVLIAQDGKIAFINKKGAEILGYSKDELTGLPFEKTLDEKYRQLVTERYQRRLQGEKVPTTYEIDVLSKTGECVPVEVSATLINYQGRPADLVIVRDIRERKRMEEERRKLEKLATIGELATMVGHDLRNPLQSIENATYYLNNELPRLPPSTPIPQKALEMLQVLNDSVNYADKIIRDLHDFSATKEPTLKKTNINTIVKETLSQVEAPENVELITELDHLPRIEADKDMIKRIFLNLTINGIQAMENGGTLKVSTKKTKGMIEVSFKDTGAGILKENMKKIFTPFFTTRAKGMGMGLPVCKKFVEIHGGSIHVESEEGRGSTFMVKLPIHQENGGENSDEEG